MPYGRGPGAWGDDSDEESDPEPQPINPTDTSIQLTVRPEDNGVYDHQRTKQVLPSIEQDDGSPKDATWASHQHPSTLQLSPASDLPPATPKRPVPQQGTSLVDASLDINSPEPPRLRDVSLQDFQCADCEEVGRDRFHCNICEDVLCPQCWPKPLKHRQKDPTGKQPRHEKTDIALDQKIEACLYPNRSPEEEVTSHKDDQAALWFGMTKTAEGYRFLEKERYNELLAGCAYLGPSELFPSLVSFIGQTGAGKSSIINLLISLSPQHEKRFDGPVVGSAENSNKPTSGNVHLYQEPGTANTQFPVFYADCEGLDGGDNAPMSEVTQKSASQDADGFETVYNSREVHGRIHDRSKVKDQIQETYQMVHHYVGKLRRLWWLGDKTGSNRQKIVENLYARILYTFSDVVVFVLKESRTIESVVFQLLEWAQTAVAQSSTQPCLPHAIIVLNMTPNSLSEEEWNSKVSTKWLFDGLDSEISNNSRFEKFIPRNHGKFTRSSQWTTQDLLQCFYATVRTIKMPGFSQGSRRPHLVDQQVKHIQQQITQNCSAVRDKKSHLRMLLNAEQFSPYLRMAFDHFSSEDGLRMPFDFVRASFIDAAIRPSFQSNIVWVGSFLLQRKPSLKTDDLFLEFGKIIASCIMLETTRNSRVGTATKLLPEYEQFFQGALSIVLDTLWPCAHRGCTGSAAGHALGHTVQIQKAKCVEVAGDYRPRDGIDLQRYEQTFNTIIEHQLEELMVNLHDSGPGTTEELVFRTLHKKNLQSFYGKHSINGYRTTFLHHSACLVCLVGLANHGLPCGHVICDACALSFGESYQGTAMKVFECPIDGKSFRSAKLITRKPFLAGVRLLSLDGGGVCGIMELIMLRELELALGGDIPIQCFFDQITGTSIGGIVALGLFINGWRVTECITQFKSLCKDAFQSSWTKTFDDWVHFVKLFRHRFSTPNLEAALQKAFSKNACLFGGSGENAALGSYGKKVTVTAASTNGSRYIFTNYNRFMPADKPMVYHMLREGEAQNAMRVWEAARATSAAPTWFEPYSHTRSHRVFMDGGLYYNNPVDITASEKKLLWGADCPVDLHVSLGCGLEPEEDIGAEPAASQRSWPQWLYDHAPNRPVWLLSRYVVDHVKTSLNAQKIWEQYAGSSDLDARRCIRLNTPFAQPGPQLHDADKIDDLEQLTEGYWSAPEPRIVIDRLAEQILATSFYFDLHNREARDVENGRLLVKGEILCRFSCQSPYREVENLGAYFRKRFPLGTDKKPYFLIRDHGYTDGKELPISDEVVTRMMDNGEFYLETRSIEHTLRARTSPLEILLCLGRESYRHYPISGFPRVMQGLSLPKEKDLC